MITALKQLHQPGLIQAACLLRNKEVEASTFEASERNYQTIARQAFSYIFHNASRVGANHNESHLEIGHMRLSGFLMKQGWILVCLSPKHSNIQLVREVVKCSQQELASAVQSA
ncbi:hypothetical protein ACFVYJ_05605 [Pontibacter sp. JAM-7]|uniref:hypothetical protein n=1 Tax=Pontibacter sp. JAM-7 TaxID=3366581 RepID=UPI003AF7D8E0